MTDDMTSNNAPARYRSLSVRELAGSPSERAAPAQSRAQENILSLPPDDHPEIPRYTRTGTFGVLDIGSTKMTCLIGRAEQASQLHILGYGWRRSRGIRNGKIVDLNEAEAAIRATVGQAEESADRRLDSVFVNISCGQPESRLFTARLPIGGRSVSHADMHRVVSEGQARAITEGRTTIHTFPVGYAVDENAHVNDPSGQVCDQLMARLHIVDASTSAIRTLQSALLRAELKVAGLIVSPLASGIAVLDRDERELGTVVVDMGGGTTSIAIFGDGMLQHTASIPVGGLHITRDLAGLLSTSLEEAERLKTKYGAAELSHEDGDAFIPVQQRGNLANPLTKVTRARLVSAIRPRIEETLEMVRDQLSHAGFNRTGRERVVLTGGASLLDGIGPMAVRILDCRVRLGRPFAIRNLPEQEANSAGFATATGLLAWAAGEDRFFHDTHISDRHTDSFVKRMINLFRGRT